MSASSKKKLRKEQDAAMLTEKQLAEQKEAKKLKIYTIVFAAVMAVVVCVALVTMAVTLINRSGVIDKNTVAAQVGEQQLNSVELSYFYQDAINEAYNNWYNNYGENLSLYTQALMGLDLTKSLDSQIEDAETGATWADYFIDIALDNAHSDYTLYNAAKAAGYTLSDEKLEELDAIVSNLELYAMLYGYEDADTYLRAIYGFGSTLESYRAYSEITLTADAYYEDNYDSFTYDDAAIRAHESENALNYNSYTYASYYMSYTEFLEGGTEDADGNTTYTDEQRDAARAAAKAAAETLRDAATSVDALDSAVAALDVNADVEDAASTKNENTLYTDISTLIRDWLAEDSRKEGDVAVLENASTTTAEDGTETTVINGYYVVYFQSASDNTQKMSNVRHLLVEFSGGTEDEHGHMTYSEDEKNTALEKATHLLDTFQAGETTEEAFIELVKENTDDTASAETGGLYENINPNSEYVENFLNWSIDEDRKVGDCEIVETEYGYHLMYYVGQSELSYRDYMITEELRTADQEAWYNGLLGAVTATLCNTNRLNKDIVLGG